MYVQPFEGALAQGPFAPLGDGGEAAMPLSPPAALGSIAGDGISRLMPPLSGGALPYPFQSTPFGPLAGMMQQLMQMLQSMLGGAPQSLAGGAGSEQYFANATAGSVGDPHLSFNGSHWTSMASQPDLLQSNSIPGGFQISTQVTPPNSQGVSWNRSATVALNGGATTVSLNDAGQASIVNMGQAVPIAPGQTVQLGSGQSVTCNANGSLAIDASNGQGGTIATTLVARGDGVDVNVTAQNVDLGGSLVTGGANAPAPAPAPISIPSPLPFGTGFPLPSPIPFVPLPGFSPLPVPQVFKQPGA